MIRTAAYIHTDRTGKEILENSTGIFDFQVNRCDVNQYGNSMIPVHWHRELEVFFLDRGSIWIDIDKKRYHMTAGEGCFINSGVLHSFQADTGEACSYRSFVFSADIVGGAPGSVFDAVYMRPLVEGNVSVHWYDKDQNDVFLYEAFQKAYAVCEKETYGYEFRLRNILSEMLLYICEKHPENTKKKITEQEQRLRMMLLWIQDHVADLITVKEVAACANVSMRECQRAFQTYLHCTPVEYITHIRMYQAAGELLQSDRSVTEIALDCGYQSMSYFSKQFKSFAACTPGEYRKRYRSPLLDKNSQLE